MKRIPYQIPNLFLIGPMGAGKTTIGRRLAQTLRREFIDSDQEIVQRAGVSVPMIFDMEGEAGFRNRERVAIAELTQKTGIILATGGGAVLDPANRRALRGRGLVIYLMVSVEEQLARIAQDENRPLLQTENPRERLEQLLTQRDPLYREIADQIVPTEGRSIRQVLRDILRAVWVG